MQSRINLKYLILAVTLGISHTLVGQVSALHQAEKKMSQKNWPEAYRVLTKILRKDSVNVQAELSMSRWFLSSLNQSHQTDSSFKYLSFAQYHFNHLIPKQKERLIRDQIDSSLFVSFRKKIDSTAFAEAKELNTEQSYNEFLKKYRHANETAVAVELRDEAAFLESLKQNSYSAFESYIQKYPNSHRASEARQRYEKLVFQSRTRDQKLKSYENFVREFPQSPYVKEAERNIFEILTSGGSPDEFIAFLKTNSKNYFYKAARDILFHLDRELEEKFPADFLTDSLKAVTELNQKLWIPFYKNGRFGFMDSDGNETINERFKIIDEYYKCGSISEDILFTDLGLVSRSAKLLSASKTYKDLGYGFLKLNDSACVSVMQKSGRVVIHDCLEDATVLDGRFLRTLKNGKFGLSTLTGRRLLANEWQSIEIIENVLVLDRIGKKTLMPLNQVHALADGNPMKENLVFDEVSRIDAQRLLVRNGSLEGIINTNLEFVVPLAIQQLSLTPYGLVRKINDKYIFSDLPELASKPWTKFQFQSQWLRLEDESGEKLFDAHAKKIIEDHPDSLWFENRLAFARLKDSVHVHINSSAHISLPKKSKTHFIKAADSVRFFFIDQKKGKQVFSIASGEKLFLIIADQIESLDANHFLIFRKNKKGVIDIRGKVILPVEYDAIVIKGSKLSLFKEKKFGQFDLKTKVLIKPSFEKNISPLGNLLVTSQGGYLGIIDDTGKNSTNFEFEELIPWTENQVWAKRDFEWSLIDFRNQQKVLTHIKSIHFIKTSINEKVAIIKQENLFGVISSTKGLIISPNFSFVMNLGSEEEPLYFTTKEVEEAGIVVVIYYDRSGKFIRKQVYEDEDYARIVCPQD